MAAEILNEYIFGDMRVRYLTDREEGQTESEMEKQV